ncbi:hypothetical protein Plhal304r1_c023g0080221 [Plasmopara halstedii]
MIYPCRKRLSHASKISPTNFLDDPRQKASSRLRWIRSSLNRKSAFATRHALRGVGMKARESRAKSAIVEYFSGSGTLTRKR